MGDSPAACMVSADLTGTDQSELRVTAETVEVLAP